MAQRKSNSIKNVKSTTATVVNCSSLNIRTLPTIESEVCGIINEGTIVVIKQKLDGWYKIKEGYVMSDYIRLD